MGKAAERLLPSPRLAASHTFHSHRVPGMRYQPLTPYHAVTRRATNTLISTAAPRYLRPA